MEQSPFIYCSVPVTSRRRNALDAILSRLQVDPVLGSVQFTLRGKVYLLIDDSWHLFLGWRIGLYILSSLPGEVMNFPHPIHNPN